MQPQQHSQFLASKTPTLCTVVQFTKNLEDYTLWISSVEGLQDPFYLTIIDKNTEKEVLQDARMGDSYMSGYVTVARTAQN